jgi:YlmC/YmxH family sporulation protein
VFTLLRVSDLRHKDIINCVDGRRLGFIRDVDMDLNRGIIKAIVVPAEMRLFSLFTRNDDLIIPWDNIKKIGIDVILVELERITPVRRLPGHYEEEQPPTISRLPQGAAKQPLGYDIDLEQVLRAKGKAVK